MRVRETELPGVLLLETRRFADERGWFSETWNSRVFREAGLHLDFVQDNHSYSKKKGTLRGLHYQAPPHAQDKLIRCTSGAILDVAVDARRGSPFYGRWTGIELRAADGVQLLVPKGFLHGCLTLMDDTEVQYKCTGYYAPHAEGAVHWDSLGIDWGLDDAPVISPRDAAAPLFSEWTSPFIYEEQA